MLVFLDQNEVAQRIRSFVMGPGANRLAVAFWGTGAIRRLGLDKAKGPIQIVCDLFSGCVNPEEVKAIKNLPDAEVRNRGGLHSKVYLFDDAVVVGSSNASLNGLCQTDDEHVDRFEANLLTDDEATIREISERFEQIWETSTAVDDAALDEAKKLFKRARAKRSPTDVFEGVLDNPALALDREAYVIWYEGEGSFPEAELDKKRTEESMPDLDYLVPYAHMPASGLLIVWEMTRTKSGRAVITYDHLWRRRPEIADQEGAQFVVPAADHHWSSKKQLERWKSAVLEFVNEAPESAGQIMELGEFARRFGGAR